VTVLHLVEPGGRGGVYQHTLQVAQDLADAGFSVIVHTATDAEALPPPEVQYCGCYSWCRTFASRRIRLIVMVTRFLFRTLPHLALVTRGKLVHIEGLFAKGLFATCVAILHRTAAQCVFSPHNTFSRSGSSIEMWALRFSVRHADICVCFSNADRRRLLEMGARRVEVAPLVQYSPTPESDAVDRWRARLSGPAKHLVVLAGQIRRDKGVADFLSAAAALVPRKDISFAIVGEDSGYAATALEICDQARLDVTVVAEYLELAEFVAVLRAADLVVAPYHRASSSGVVSLAARVGTPAVAYPVGGLIDSGAMLTATADPGALADTIMEALTIGPEPPTAVTPGSWIPNIYGHQNQRI
jgi:glycosyltransferase involved in cell wall biosynthesis